MKLNLKSILAPLALAMALTLSLSSCTTPTGNTLTNTLETITLTSELAIDVIAATGSVDPATLAQVSAYLHAVDKSTAEAATILASSDSDTKKAADIITAFNSAVEPIWMTGANPKVVAVVNAVVAAVKVLLAHFGQVQLVTGSVSGVNGLTTSKAPKPTPTPIPATLKLPTTTPDDKTKLKSIAARARTASDKAGRLLTSVKVSPVN